MSTLRVLPLVRRSELVLPTRELLPPTPGLTSGQRVTLRAALLVFAERGFGGARVRDIAAVAGVQPGNLYNHFPSKYEMLAELAHLGHAEFLSRQTSALLVSGSDPRDQLAAIVRSGVTCNVTYPELTRVINHELGHLTDDVLAPAQACYAQALATVEEVVCRGLEADLFTVPDLTISIVAVGSLVRDAARWFPDQSLYSAEQVAEELVGCALRMVGARADQ